MICCLAWFLHFVFNFVSLSMAEQRGSVVSQMVSGGSNAHSTPYSCQGVPPSGLHQQSSVPSHSQPAGFQIGFGAVYQDVWSKSQKVLGGVSGPLCWCGQASTQRAAQIEGQNKGRVFFACGGSQCKYFEWADETVKSVEGEQQIRQSLLTLPQAPLCHCEQLSVPACVRKVGVNEGRFVFKCSKLMQTDCGFFAWADNPPRPKPPSNLPLAPSCYCKQLAVLVSARKSGPNEGRWFF